MKNIVLSFTLFLTACNNSPKTVLKPKKDKTISDVVNNIDSSSWLFVSGKKEEQIWSTIIHFNLDSPDKVGLEFNSECWAFFKLQQKDDTIKIIWPPDLDTKYQFNIIKEINKVPSDFNGRPFILLTLQNDTTLKAIYTDTILLKKLNNCEKGRILLPDYYFLDKRN